MIKPTTTTNFELGRMLNFDTLTQGLDYAAQGRTGLNFYSSRGKLEHSVTYAQVRERALDVAQKLTRLGIARGERVAIIAETAPEFMDFFYGCQYAGILPVTLPYSMHIGGHEAYVARLRGMIGNARPQAIISSPDMLEFVREAAVGKNVAHIGTYNMFYTLPSEGGEIRPFEKDDLSYIQYSSGSTSAPKGVLISQRAITSNACCSIGEGALALTDHDRAVSWLPLYHDMGLVGFCLNPMMSQTSVDYLPTSAFARRPLLWLKLISENRATVSFSPMFGYELAMRRVPADLSDYDLSCWRVAGIGGDMVRSDVLQKFARHYKAAGFDERAFMPCYGMAEATLAISFSGRGKPLETDVVDRVQMKLKRQAVPVDRKDADSKPDKVRHFALCGKVLAGHALQVRDAEGAVLPDREVGHVWFRGPSLMEGYFENPEATSEVMDEDGWFNTGDMGYMLNSEIVITGRHKDLILHNGRNIWPQDIEWAVEHHEALRGGDVAAFGVNGGDAEEHVVVLVQCRISDEDEREVLRRDVRATVHQYAGVECNVVLIPPRSLPFTSSGKLSRAGAKAIYLGGEMAEVDLPAKNVAGATMQGAA